MNRIMLNDKFKNDTPILPNVELIAIWNVWDGPLYGICEINDKKFFFLDIVESIWRHYSKNDYERAWRIYGVYDIAIERVETIMRDSATRRSWQDAITDESDCIGIFWDYKDRSK